MAVKRIVTDIEVENTREAQAFYGAILDMNIVMDLGWIMTFAATSSATPQISFATEGGSGTAVPNISIEVDNLEEVYERVLQSDYVIEYKLTDEPWGVRRFFVRDPFGRLVNILDHL